MEKNPFLKYLIKDDKEDFFHTSGHAMAQSGSNMGVSSTETFAQRRKIDQNRTRIKKYSDSRIAAQAMAGHERAKVYTPPENNAGNAGVVGSTGSAGGAVGAGGAGRSSLGGGTTRLSGAARPPMPRR